MVACRPNVSSLQLLVARLWLMAWQCSQVWSAVKSTRHLKQTLLYLIAYFMLQESKSSGLTNALDIITDHFSFRNLLPSYRYPTERVCIQSRKLILQIFRGLT